MRFVAQIRRWQKAGLSILLCLALHGLAIAQTSAATAKPVQTSAVPAKKTHATSHATSKTTAHKSSTHTAKGARGKKGSKKTTKRGQQAIDSTRARDIQEALIRVHYLDGEPSGTWDTATQAAMRRYQEDRGWQSKTTPDARALIKLGLGPNHDHLLNPQSAMTTSSAPAPADPKAAAKQAPPEDNTPQQ
jgi:Putative peptidoglycan binding domain